MFIEKCSWLCKKKKKLCSIYVNLVKDLALYIGCWLDGSILRHAWGWKYWGLKRLENYGIPHQTLLVISLDDQVMTHCPAAFAA